MRFIGGGDAAAIGFDDFDAFNVRFCRDVSRPPMPMRRGSAG